MQRQAGADADVFVTRRDLRRIIANREPEGSPPARQNCGVVEQK